MRSNKNRRNPKTIVLELPESIAIYNLGDYEKRTFSNSRSRD